MLSSDSPEYAANGLTAKYLRATVVLSRDRHEIVLFAVNRSGEESVELEWSIENFAVQKIAEAVEITADSLDAVNTETVENVKPSPFSEGQIVLEAGTVRAALNPHSWNCIRIRIAADPA